MFPIDDGLLDDGHGNQGVLGSSGYPHQNGERIERFSRKVFVGGLPPDIDEGEWRQSFVERDILVFFSHIYSLLFFTIQTRSPLVSGALVTWWLIGRTKLRANPTFLRKVIIIIYSAVHKKKI